MALPEIQAQQYTADDARRLYQELDARAAAETRPAVKAALLEQRDAVESGQFVAGLDVPEVPAQPPIPFVEPAVREVRRPDLQGGGFDLPAPAAAPTPGSVATESAALGVAPPSFNTFFGGGNPREAARLRGQAAQHAGAANEAGIAQEQGVAARGALAEQAGNTTGDAIVQGIGELDRLNREREGQRQTELAAQQAVKSARDSAMADYEREEAAQGKSVLASMGTGDRVAAGIAVGLGAFGAALNGGPNTAYNIINDSVNHEVRARQERLAAKGKAADAFDRFLLREMESAKDSEAVYESGRAALLGRVGLSIDEHAARFQGADARAQADILKAQLEQQREASTAAALEKAAKRFAGSRPQLKDAVTYAELLKKYQEVNGVGPGGIDQEALQRVGKELDRNGVLKAKASIGELERVLGDAPPGVLERILASDKNPVRALLTSPETRDATAALVDAQLARQAAVTGIPSDRDAAMVELAANIGTWSTPADIVLSIKRLNNQNAAVENQIYAYQGGANPVALRAAQQGRERAMGATRPATVQFVPQGATARPGNVR